MADYSENLGIVIKSLRENIEIDIKRLRRIEQIYGIKNCGKCKDNYNKPWCMGVSCSSYPKIY